MECAHTMNIERISPPVKKGGCRVNAFAMPGMYYRWKKDDTIYDGWFMNCVTDCETNENRV